jgi:hypothetical protein
MHNLHFSVSTQLVIGGCTHNMSDYLGQPASSDRASDFFLHAWMGDSSFEHSIGKIEPDGTSVVNLRVVDGDVNTVKLGVVFTTPSRTGPRAREHCSSFIPVPDLLGHLMSTHPSTCFFMKDNFNQNAAILTFKNLTTDTEKVQGLSLRPSALLQQDDINQAVFTLGTQLRNRLTTCSVVSSNAGSEFLDGFTFFPMQGILSNYGTLGFTFQCMRSAVTLPLTVYNAYTTLASTGMLLGSLAALSDSDLVHQFGVHLVTRQTACGFTTPYSSDLAETVGGRVTKDDEEITMSLSGMQLYAQGAGRVFTPDKALASETTAQHIAALRAAAAVPSPFRAGLSPALLNDDCENAAQCVMRMGDGLSEIATDFDGAHSLACTMARLSDTHPLFTGIPMAMHVPMAECLHRLGSLILSKKWDLAFAVVSAKGASYSTDSGSSTHLSGHATVVSRCADLGQTYQYSMCEGTSYITTDSPPAPGRATHVEVLLADKSRQKFDLAEMGTILAQNIHQIAGISADARILAHLRARYDNPQQDTPFYVSMFYTGLQQGNKTFGCVPLDTSMTGAPVFGVPCMALDRATSIAIPLEPGMMHADPTGATGRHTTLAGVTTGLTSVATREKDTMALLCRQTNEIFPPPGSSVLINAVMSHWQPCATLESELPSDPTMHIRAECMYAFDDPNHTARAAALYTALAADFNRRQAADPTDDGIRLVLSAQFLSAGLRARMPIPLEGAEAVHLCAMSNLRAAVASLGMEALVAHPTKAAAVNAQAAIESRHPFFMCAQGNGLVHSHRTRLS